MKIKSSGQAETRLDKFLSKQLKDINRSQIKKMIDKGEVFVNGREAKGSYQVKERDLIEIKEKKEKKKKDLRSLNTKKKGPFKKIKIVAETDDYLVVDKPAGLVVHGAPHIKEDSLADWLLDKYPEIEGVGEDKERPGIVHRLDKDASGLMVVAKTQTAYNDLKKQFQKRQVLKHYQALVYGRPAKDEDKIDFPIKRSSAGNKQAAVPGNFKDENNEAREALTYFKTKKQFINYTLLDVEIKTGRKHQIRVHLHAYGHPLVGDSLYSTKKTKELNKKIGLDRIFLVAYKLSFKDLSGQRQEFVVNLPLELKELLKNIK
ncbi:RluA family pseudouridine synthase [Candidatus Falkowbacteria bacterium]|nr:RluA family pseudouridine synthase [Candidatus Falkowbacteria bacterium]